MLAMNWFGNETLHRTPFTNMTIHGESVAAVQNVENFSFAYVLHPSTTGAALIDFVSRRVYQAGHEIVRVFFPWLPLV